MISNVLGLTSDAVAVHARTLHEFKIKRADGETDIDFSSLKGKVVVCANVASKCGLTNDMYDHLGAVASKYGQGGKDLVVIAFPCGQFMKQEFDKGHETCEFARKKLEGFKGVFNVSFFLTEKIDVNGKNTHPIFQFLKLNSSLAKSNGKVSPISWNFGKFLVDRDGKVVKYFGPKDTGLDAAIPDVISGKVKGQEGKVSP